MNNLLNSKPARRVLLCSRTFPLSPHQCKRHPPFQPARLSAPRSVTAHRAPSPPCSAAISSWHRRPADLQQKLFFFFFFFFFFFSFFFFTLAYPSDNS